MKLFKAIAATAAVITCCAGNPLPAEANSQWSKVYPLSQDYISYVKGIRRNGNIVSYRVKIYNKNTRESWAQETQANCGNWTTRYQYESGKWSNWNEMLPETAGGAEVSFVCRNS